MARRADSHAPWTGDAPPPPSRWTALIPLGLGLALGLGLFVWWMIPKPPPKTRLALIEITNYGDEYPELGPSKSTPWHEILVDEKQATEKRPLDSKEQVQARLDQWINPEPKSPHTLVLVIRCHAAMNAQGGCQLLTGEVGQGNHYPVADFLKDVVKKCQFKNTLVVADICDLNYAPYLGYIVNPIADALQNDCKSIQDELKECNLWILCAAADGQPSFRDRLGKTLFQEGVVESLRTLKEKNVSDFSVADFYQQVCNHCGSHSRGAQTPILIRATDAQETRIPWLNFERGDWFRDKASDTADAGKSNEEPPKENAPKEKAPYPFEETWTKIQKVRQTTEPTNPTAFQWQPFERDPFAWRQALAIQAMLDLDLVDNKNPPALDYFEKLNPSESRPPDRTSSEPVLAWENPEEVLSGDDLQRWKRIRDPFRAYLRTVAEWVAWRDLVLRLPREPEDGSKGLSLGIPNEKRLRDASKKLEEISKILKVQALVDPSSNATSNWLQDIDLDQLDDAQRRNKEVTEELLQSVDRLVRDLTRPNEKWSWMLEQQCLVALQFPLLTNQQRETLYRRLKESANSKKNASIEDWSSKLPNANVSNANIKNRFDLFRESMTGLPMDNPKLQGLAEATKTSDMLAWGKKYQESYGAESARADTRDGTDHPLRQWFRAALRELPPLTANPNVGAPPNVPLVAFVPGNPNQKRLSLSPKDPREKWIDLKRAEQQGEKLAIQLRNADDSCKLRWHIERDGKPFVGVVSGLQLLMKSDGNKNAEWKYNQDVPNPKSARTELELKVEGSLQPEDLGRPSDKIVVQWREDSETLSEGRLPILCDEKRLDLVIRPKGGSPLYPNMDGRMTNPFLAMAGYPVEFSVEVRNKRPELRRARVILYEQIGGVKTDLLRSKSIDLSQELDLSQEPKVVEFEKALTEGREPSSVGNLRWRVEELDIPASASDPASQAAAPETKLKQQWDFQCDFRPINPGKYLEVDNIRNQTAAEPNQQYDVPLQLSKDFWDNVPLSKKESTVPVRVRWHAVPRTENKDNYSTSISPPGSKPSESKPQQRPVMEKGVNRFDYEFDIGDYPRAAFWNVEYPGPSGSKKTEITPESPSEIKDQTPLQFHAIDKKDGLVPAQYGPAVDDGPQIIIVRTWRWEDWDKKGEQKASPTKYEIQGIQLEALSRDGKDGIDGVGGMVPWCLVNRADERKSTGSFPDRDILADQLIWEETKISFAPKVREARTHLFNNMLMQPDSQRYDLKIGLANPCEAATWSRTLVFDQDKPEIGELKAESTELKAEAGLQVRVTWNGKPDRGGAGIAEGYLAIRGPQQSGGTDKDIYDFRSKVKLKTIGEPKGEELVFDIKADDLEGLKKEFPKPCDLRINAMVVDRAGNFQVEHKSLTVKWNPAPAAP
jgi:hypothetical protein